MEGIRNLFSASNGCFYIANKTNITTSLSLPHHHFSCLPRAQLTKTSPSRCYQRHHVLCFPLPPSSSFTSRKKRRHRANFISNGTTSSRKAEVEVKSSPKPAQSGNNLDCVGTGLDVECVFSTPIVDAPLSLSSKEEPLRVEEEETTSNSLIEMVTDTGVLVSPFFFWGTAMVAMKGVLPLTGPFFVAAFRLIPAGLLLVVFAAYKGRPLPSGLTAWLSITLFALVDASCFQGFLAQGLLRTSAGLGSVIIDSQPLTVALLANLLFDESISIVGAPGLVLGVVGLLLLEVPTLTFDESNFSLWGSGEWWMLLAAQSMAVGTVMVRWVSKYSDPVWQLDGEVSGASFSIQRCKQLSGVRRHEGAQHTIHMVIGGLPLLAISILNHDPAFSLNRKDLTASDISALLYTSIFGSAISYGVFFYSATKGSLTKLSSLTFLTPMFASIFGFLYLGETLSPLQLFGAIITLVAIYMVNYQNNNE